MKGKKIGALILLLFLLGLSLLAYTEKGKSVKPDPEKLQTPNPIIEVESLEEMEDYLDFALPELEKEVAGYSVIVVDDYPFLGQIDYADGSEFRMAYGSEDVSGIYGGSPGKEETISGLEVTFYHYEDQELNVDYAIWEEDGFSFSYSYVENGSQEIEELIQLYQAM